MFNVEGRKGGGNGTGRPRESCRAISKGSCATDPHQSHSRPPPSPVSRIQAALSGQAALPSFQHLHRPLPCLPAQEGSMTWPGPRGESWPPPRAARARRALSPLVFLALGNRARLQGPRPGAPRSPQTLRARPAPSPPETPQGFLGRSRREPRRSPARGPQRQQAGAAQHHGGAAQHLGPPGHAGGGGRSALLRGRRWRGGGAFAGRRHPLPGGRACLPEAGPSAPPGRAHAGKPNGAPPRLPARPMTARRGGGARRPASSSSGPPSAAMARDEPPHQEKSIGAGALASSASRPCADPGQAEREKGAPLGEGGPPDIPESSGDT